MSQHEAYTILLHKVSLMPLQELRSWIVKMRMVERSQHFNGMAKRHKLTTWHLAAAVNGKANWSPRIIKTLQDDLKMDLTPLLTKQEASKL